MRCRKTLFIAMLFALTALVAGCGSGINYVYPTVETNVANGETGIPLTKVFTITFQKGVDTSTVTASSFFLVLGSSGSSADAVSSTVGCASAVECSLAPTSVLVSNTIYTLYLTEAIRYTNGSAFSAMTITVTTAAYDVPQISSVSPVADATDVATTSNVSVIFSNQMDSSTINDDTFLLSSPTASVTGTISYNSTMNAATFTPSSLATSTRYTATLTTGIKDSGNVPIASNYAWSFTTAAAPSPTYPQVDIVDPANGATHVLATEVIMAQFDSDMDSDTIDTTSFTLVTTIGGDTVAGAVAYVSDTKTATFTPSSSLLSNRGYTATITTGAQDTSGTGLEEDYTWTFTTDTAPTVSETIPTDGAEEVATNSTLSVVFDQAMDVATITTATIALEETDSGTPVTGTVDYDSGTKTATFTPDSSLANLTNYTAAITTGAKNTYGTPLQTAEALSFTTVAATPIVVVTAPIDGEESIPISATVTATFSQDMDDTTITTSSFTLEVTDGAAVSGDVTYDADTMTATFAPDTSLSNSTNYTATITTDVKNIYGISLAAEEVWTFTTVGESPAVTVISPLNGATDVAIDTTVTGTFSIAMNASTITTSSFTLAITDGAAVAGGVAYNAETKTATFTPSLSLENSTNYTATIATSVESAGGVPLASAKVWAFTTVAASSGWVATSVGDNVPAVRKNHTAVWTGTTMIVWGGEGSDADVNTGGRYDPVGDTWTPTSTVDAPAARSDHAAVWTGTEMIVWGGTISWENTNTGGIYSLVTDSWVATSTGLNVPTARCDSAIAWDTVNEKLIIWGGYTDAPTNTGGVYDPNLESWAVLTTTDAPVARYHHTALWAGNKMIVWGGNTASDAVLNSGGVYDPSSEGGSWAATSTGDGLPPARGMHTALWTGSTMIVWGGMDAALAAVNTGGVYNLAGDSWTLTSTPEGLAARMNHSAVWADTEMVVWGGHTGGYSGVNTGDRYNPVGDTWTAVTTTDAPAARYSHTAVWTGTQMIVWGGQPSGELGKVNTGGRWTP